MENCSQWPGVDGASVGARLCLAANAERVEVRFGMRSSLCASTAVLALVAASALPMPAVAADLSIAPIYKAASVPTWAGSYVGLAGGGAWGGATLRNNLTGTDQTPRLDLGGGLFGITSGLNLQSQNWVLGLEADISAVSKKGSAFEF